MLRVKLALGQRCRRRSPHGADARGRRLAHPGRGHGARRAGARRRCARAGAEVASLEVAEPELEEVFVKIMRREEAAHR